MKLLVVIAIGFFLLLGAASCKGDFWELIDTDEFFTVKGRLLRSCDDKTPLGNRTMSILADRGFIFCARVNIEDVTTDINGFFSFRYENEGCASFLSLSAEDSLRNSIVDQEVVMNIPVFENIDLGEVFLINDKPYLYEIKTNAGFSGVDTLFYDIKDDYYKDSVYRFITGPFSSGQVLTKDTARGWPLIFMNGEHTRNFDLGSHWILKSGNTIHKRGGHEEIFKPCVENKVIIDLTK